MTPLRLVSLAGLVSLMAGSGILHLRKPELYLPIVPRILGNPEPYVFWSGVLEILAAMLLIVPATRRLAGLLTVAILLGVFPANVQMALDGPQPGAGWFAGSPALLWLRLPLQPVLIYWAWTFARNPVADEGTGTAAGSA